MASDALLHRHAEEEAQTIGCAAAESEAEPKTWQCGACWQSSVAYVAGAGEEDAKHSGSSQQGSLAASERADCQAQQLRDKEHPPALAGGSIHQVVGDAK